MFQSEPKIGEQVLAPGDVEIRLGADLKNLSVIRAVAANIALRADFDLDSVEDIKLAVDEMCSTLITRARPSSTLTCCFRTSDDGIGVHAYVPSGTDQPVYQRSFGWRVLSTLTSSVRTWITEDDEDPGGNLSHIEITKNQRMAPGE